MTKKFAYVNLINQIALSENVINEDQVNIYTFSLHYLLVIIHNFHLFINPLGQNLIWAPLCNLNFKYR